MANIRKGTKVRFREGNGWAEGKVVEILGDRAKIEAKRKYPQRHGKGPAGETYLTSRALDKLERAA